MSVTALEPLTVGWKAFTRPLSSAAPQLRPREKNVGGLMSDSYAVFSFENAFS